MANGVVWKRHVDHLWKIINSPQGEEEVSVTDINDSGSSSLLIHGGSGSPLPTVNVPDSANGKQRNTAEPPVEGSSFHC